MNNYINQIILTAILLVMAFLGTQARNLYRKYVNTEIKQAVCKTAVLFVEQVYKDIHGPDKLAAAMVRASDILKEYGIEISNVELTAMLEAAVREFINSFNSGDGASGDSDRAKYEIPAATSAVEAPAPAYADAAAETGGSASLSEIIEDLKAEE